MSDKCDHNNHHHFLLWMFVLSLCFNSSCVDCSGDQARSKQKMLSLDHDVHQLMNEVSSLKGRVSSLEEQLSKSNASNKQLTDQIEQLRNVKKGFYK